LAGRLGHAARDTSVRATMVLLERTKGTTRRWGCVRWETRRWHRGQGRVATAARRLVSDSGSTSRQGQRKEIKRRTIFSHLETDLDGECRGNSLTELRRGWSESRQFPSAASLWTEVRGRRQFSDVLGAGTTTICSGRLDMRQVRWILVRERMRRGRELAERGSGRSAAGQFLCARAGDEVCEVADRATWLRAPCALGASAEGWAACVLAAGSGRRGYVGPARPWDSPVSMAMYCRRRTVRDAAQRDLDLRRE
jgi:hypothetical protein